ncbi:T9SS type A sorting domain-containing protein [Polaribacter sp. Asnod1-A03]|uniref:T9SS type A sorting domain-containing protein n=1 Tax=Polaribacter sp. Asnod1-A03 TaxID=3160581 RepID=UPI003867E7E5
MKQKITFYLFYFLFISFLQSQSVNWVEHFGGASEDVLKSATIDANGNTYSTGYFAENSTFSNIELNAIGYFNSFVTKTDATGKILWAKSLAQPNDDDIDDYHSVITKSIAVDASGNIIIAGYFDAGEFDADPGEGEYILSAANYEMFIIKLDENGNFIWAQSFGSSTNSFESVSEIDVDANGNIYLTGYFSDSISISHAAGTSVITSYGGSDIFVMKYYADGSFLWMKHMGSEDADLGMSLDVSDSGDVFVTGRISATATFYTPMFFGDPVTINVNEGYNSSFALKLDSSGDFIDVVEVGEADSENTGTSIALDLDGYAYVTGYYGGILVINEGTDNEMSIDSDTNYEGYVAKVDFTNENISWIKEIDGGTDSVFGYTVDTDSNNNIYVGGFFSETLTVGDYSLTRNTSKALESYLVTLDNSGEFLGAYQYGGLNSVDGQTLVININDDILLAGSFSGNVDISPFETEDLEITSNGYRDNYLVTTNMNQVLSNPDNKFINGLKVYPNPSEDVILISSELNLKGSRYFIFDVSGKSVLSGKLTENKEVSINHLDKGLYFLQIIKENNQQQTLKIIKK